MSFRSVAFLTAMLSMAPLGLLAAQQAASPTAMPAGAATEAVVGAPADVTPAPSVPRPQYSPLFQKSDSAPTLGTSDRAMASEGKSHTIVLSTLALILVVVILVLLIA